MADIPLTIQIARIQHLVTAAQASCAWWEANEFPFAPPWYTEREELEAVLETLQAVQALEALSVPMREDVPFLECINEETAL